MKSQLFNVRPVDLPSSWLSASNGGRVSFEHIEHFPFMRWPDGRPCDVVNEYFIEIAHAHTGKSLVTFASQLSYLVRYCWVKGLPISALSDEHIHEFVAMLTEEKSLRPPREFARNHNTTRGILKRAIMFLLWYQKNWVLPYLPPLIGIKKSSPQIIIRRIVNKFPKKGQPKSYYTHRAMPPDVTVDPKRPIALNVIEAIERAIDELSGPESQKAAFVKRFRNRPELLSAQLNYMRSRRHFMLWLMKRTGLRPAEMFQMSVDAHKDILREKRLLIPTMKRRRENPPPRRFPITLKDSTVFHRYLVIRGGYVAILKENGFAIENLDALFLGVNGGAIKKTSLERDFSRLVVTAGFKDVRTCFSMFRHRFITYEVIVHIKEFMVESGKMRHGMGKTDYESILKRVATKTGHASAESLWNYIDLAWEEIGVWGSIDKALLRIHAADRLFEDLLELKSDLGRKKGLAATKKVVAEVLARLESILTLAKEDIETTEIPFPNR
ncbi:tyrosine-type recombinase/integrase [Duganella sp. LjRoot269]|uniref:tyrosine-type recombinase/integrase n=1 Tax=Duganella sp. LjRoot269 TaxID=3342305 RepID=UPI003ECE5F64